MEVEFQGEFAVLECWSEGWNQCGWSQEEKQEGWGQQKEWSEMSWKGVLGWRELELELEA